MATTAGTSIAIIVATVAPVAPPAEYFADHGPDSWQITYKAVGGDLTLGASAGAPAILWAWNLETNTWSQFERAFRISDRVVIEGNEASDLVQRSVPNVGALALVYPGLLDSGAAVFTARTIRSVQ